MLPCAPIIGAVALPNVGSIVGGIVVRKNLKPWYEGLKKPTWNPPDWVFPPVWTALYSSIGYSSYLVYQSGSGFQGAAQLPLIVYGSNLALNWAWTPIFFELHNIELAFYEILLVDITAGVTAYLFYKVNPLAGYIMAPYLAWLGFATALSYNYYKNNKSEAKIVEIKEE